MNRSSRSAIVAVSLWFVFVAGVRVAAEEKSTDSPRPAKEALRYDGKSFVEWRALLLTELKPERRCEAFKALAMFGVNGYGSQAATAIAQAIRGNTPQGDKDDEEVVNAAEKALVKIGEPAIAVLAKALKSDAVRRRVMAAHSLGLMESGAETVLPQLEAALKDASREVRMTALDSAVGRTSFAFGGCLEGECILHGDNERVAFLIKAIEVPDAEIREEAIGKLQMMKSKAKSATPKLLIAVKDKDASVRKAALKALVSVQAEPKTALPVVTAALNDDDRDVRLAALEFLQYAGADAKDAVPALIDALKRQREMSNEVVEMADTLAKIGPAAKDAVPTLKEALKLPAKKLTPGSVSRVVDTDGSIREAIRAIEGEAQPK